MRKGNAILAMAAMMGSIGATLLPQEQQKTSAKRRTLSKGWGRVIRLEYPEHYTDQQRGFTPSGGAKNHFQHSNLNSNPYQIGRSGYALNNI